MRPEVSNNLSTRKRLALPTWSHQHELTRLKGKRIVVTYSIGSVFKEVFGVLEEADQFTVKVGGQVFFKSALLGFAETK